MQCDDVEGEAKVTDEKRGEWEVPQSLYCFVLLLLLQRVVL
jgi:hypothetical protein